MVCTKIYVFGAYCAKKLYIEKGLMYDSAGGLGYELLKDLALSGFGRKDIIDMDTILIVNSLRGAREVWRFFDRIVFERFALSDFCTHGLLLLHLPEKIPFAVRGLLEATLSPYALLSARTSCLVHLRSRCEGEGKPYSMRKECGNLVISHLEESIEAMTNLMANGRKEIQESPHAFSAQCGSFPPKLAETPRSPAHCLEYVHLIQWGQERTGESFDTDNPERMKWIYKQATKRAEDYNISGVTYTLTQGVGKIFIPAIASTNAIIAATCAVETLKITTMCSTSMDVFMQYVSNLSRTQICKLMSRHCSDGQRRLADVVLQCCEKY